MARRWSVKKDAQTTTLDKETRMSYALKNREEQGRIVSPEARSSPFTFRLSTCYILQHQHARYSSWRILFDKARHAARVTTHTEDFSSFRGWPRKRSWKVIVPSVIDISTKLERKIKGTDVTRHSSGSGQATTQLHSLQTSCTHATQNGAREEDSPRWGEKQKFHSWSCHGKLNSRDSRGSRFVFSSTRFARSIIIIIRVAIHQWLHSAFVVFEIFLLTISAWNSPKKSVAWFFFVRSNFPWICAQREDSLSLWLSETKLDTKRGGKLVVTNNAT